MAQAVIQVYIPGAIAVIGLLWVAWPRQQFLVPGGLFLDERVAARFGLSSDAWSRVRRAAGGSAARDVAEARLAGAAFAVIGISALATRMPAMLALVSAVVVLYSVVLWSATSHSMGARAVRARGKRGARFTLGDVASVAMLGPIGNTVILVCVPSFTARCLAVLVGAVLVVVAAVFAATAPDDAASPLARTVAARRACGLTYSAISAANILALAYGTLDLDAGSEYGVILLGWAAVSMAVLAYHARARFEALNETLRSAVR